MQTVDYAAGQFEDEGSLAGVMELFEQWNPGLRLGWSRQRGESEWRQERGSRVCWIQQGAGEVWVPAGYRTKEGDGDPLPRCYHPEAAPREWVEAVRRATARAACFKGNVRAALERIASRLRGEYYLGDAANELWTWIQYSGQAPDAEFASFIDLFRRVYDRVGFSVKQESGWEPVQAGDQILAGPEPLLVRGELVYWSIEAPETVRHISALRRLRYLKDTAGGCNFQFDAFRRMPLTWYADRGVTPDNPDGINQVNSHYVNIAAETSRAHYHPREAVGGGKPQGELYLVADPAVYWLSTYGRAAAIELWPEIEGANRDGQHKVTVPLRAGSIVYITPGTGHRGVDVFANVVVLPGYKPANQYFFEDRNWAANGHQQKMDA